MANFQPGDHVYVTTPGLFTQKHHYGRVVGREVRHGGTSVVLVRINGTKERKWVATRLLHLSARFDNRTGGASSTFHRGDRVYVKVRSIAGSTDRSHYTVVTGRPSQRLWEGIGHNDRVKEPHLLVQSEDTGQKFWEPVRTLRRVSLRVGKGRR